MTNETNFQEEKPVYYILDNCTRCGRCAQKCPLHALVPRQGHYRIDLRFCDGCGICYEICPIGAVERKNTVAVCAAREQLQNTGDQEL